MNNIKTKIMPFLSLIITTILLLPSESLAVGFHSAGGGSSGGGSSGGDLYVDLVILCIILIISYFVRRKQISLALLKQDQLNSSRDSFLTEDYNFSIELLESQIQNNILDVLYALIEGDRDQLSIYCTEKYVDKILLAKQESSTNIAYKLSSQAEHICWIDVNVNKIYTVENYDYIELYLNFKIINSTGTVSSIDKISVTLKRRDKVISRDLNQQPTLNNCKSCGAPMDFNASHTCQYCGSTSKLSEDDTWMIDNISGSLY